ncbi:hypothetical protein Bca101_056322 [Brassica carinata]
MTSGAGDGVSRRRWASLMTMLLSFTCLFLFCCLVCWLPVCFSWPIKGERSRRTLLRRRECRLFIALFRRSLLLDGLTPATSREGSLRRFTMVLVSTPVDPLSAAVGQVTQIDCLCPSNAIGASFSTDELNLSISGELFNRSISQSHALAPMGILFDGGSSPLREFSATSLSTLSGVSHPMFPSHTAEVNGFLLSFAWAWPIGETISSPRALPMARDVSSDSWSSVCFDFFIGLSSCVAVSTGPEDAIEITSVVLVDEGWTSTSHYVTILQLSDSVEDFVLCPLSSSVEDLSCLAYLYVVVYAYCQRGWLIPSFYCIEEV